MANFHHKPIKRFTLEGQIHDDSVIGRLKNEYIRLIITEMKISGYVPRLDIDPDFTISFNKKSEYFEFKLSVHGVYAGKKKSEWILGIDGTTPIYTQKNRLNESLQEQV
jgi:hypothetical protein